MKITYRLYSTWFRPYSYILFNIKTVIYTISVIYFLFIIIFIDTDDKYPFSNISLRCNFAESTESVFVLTRGTACVDKIRIMIPKSFVVVTIQQESRKYLYTNIEYHQATITFV